MTQHKPTTPHPSKSATPCLFKPAQSFGGAGFSLPLFRERERAVSLNPERPQ